MATIDTQSSLGPEQVARADSRPSRAELEAEIKRLRARLHEVERLIGPQDNALGFVQRIIDAHQDAVVIVNRQHEVLLANKTAWQFAVEDPDHLGLDCSKCAGCAETKRPAESRPCMLEQVLMTGEPVRLLHRHEGSDGRDRDLEVTASPIRDSAGEVVGMVQMSRDVTDQRRAESERQQIIDELKQALADVNALSGMLPICASCKKVRDDQGYWSQIEEYLAERSSLLFSHGICPDCSDKLYPGLKRRSGGQR